jgi:hypothetical protein
VWSHFLIPIISKKEFDSMPICIICKQEKELTSEHIFPEFMGGGLEVSNVCKCCNGRMGTGFEQRISSAFITKSHRFKHDIKGKSVTPFPFSDTYIDEDTDIKFNMERNGTLKSRPVVSLTDNEKGISISLLIDKEEITQAKPIIVKKIARHLKSKGIDLNSEKIAIKVDNLLVNNSFNKKNINNPMIKMNVSVDFNDIELLHIKIAYELACYHFGDKYIEDSVANELRLSLYDQQVKESVHIQMPMENNPFKTFLDDEHYWVVFCSLGCFIKDHYMNSIICYTSEGSQFISTEGIVYKFCYKTQNFEKYSLMEIVGLTRKKRLNISSI